MTHVKTAAKRVLDKNGVVVQLKQALRDDNAEHARAVDEAIKCEQAATKASADLKLARAQASAAKRMCDVYSRAHRTLRFILARWG